MTNINSHSNKMANLQDQTRASHTLDHHVALPVSGRWHVSDQVSELMVTVHHVHKISDTHTHSRSILLLSSKGSYYDAITKQIH